MTTMLAINSTSTFNSVVFSGNTILTGYLLKGSCCQFVSNLITELGLQKFPSSVGVGFYRFFLVEECGVLFIRTIPMGSIY